jgi:hypothetical protein
MSAVRSILHRCSQVLGMLSGLLVMVTVGLGVQWYRDPTGNYEPLIYVMGAIASLFGVPSLVEWLTKSGDKLHPPSTAPIPSIAEHLPKKAAADEQGNLSVEVEVKLPSQPIYGVVERFKQIFTSHNISLTQLPRFIDAHFGMSLADLRTDDTLLLKLNDEMLYWVAETFNVRRRWIDGDDERIYATPDYYKCVYKFIDFFVDLLARGNKPEVFAFKTTKELSTDITLYSYAGLLISIEIGAIDGKPVRRYYPIETDWLWHHWRSRYEFKAIVYLLGLLSVYPRSFDLAPNLLGLLGAGWIFPETLLRGHGIGYPPYTRYSWYADDYVETEGGGARREIEEADKIIEFVHDEGHFKRLQQKIQEHNLWIRNWEVVKTLGGYPKLRT